MPDEYEKVTDVELGELDPNDPKEVEAKIEQVEAPKPNDK